MKQRCKITLTIILIILSLLPIFFRPLPQVAMKRESITPDLIIQPTDLAAALDLSLSLGDGRRVNWSGLGWEV